MGAVMPAGRGVPFVSKRGRRIHEGSHPRCARVQDALANSDDHDAHGHLSRARPRADDRRREEPTLPIRDLHWGGVPYRIKIDEALFKELAKGKEAKVSFFDGSQKVVTVVLALEGFAEAYAAMK